MRATRGESKPSYGTGGRSLRNRSLNPSWATTWPRASRWLADQWFHGSREAELRTTVTRLSGVSYTLRGVSYLLHRMGFIPQVPVHRAAERDEDAIAAWRSQTWAKVRG